MQAHTPDQIRVDTFVRTADRDLDVARLILQGSPHFYESIGFHCQQAAEKYLKAGLVMHGLPVPYTHDLARLVNEQAAFLPFTPAEQAAAAALLEFAVDLRYEFDDAPSFASADLVAMADLFRTKLRPLALAFLI
ncbi:MAG TPA: HEPN domain-containing protein [Hymenobacter sp.]|jgi:HEPN domain-containing protein